MGVKYKRVVSVAARMSCSGRGTLAWGVGAGGERCVVSGMPEVASTSRQSMAVGNGATASLAI